MSPGPLTAFLQRLSQVIGPYGGRKRRPPAGEVRRQPGRGRLRGSRPAPRSHGSRRWPSRSHRSQRRRRCVPSRLSDTGSQGGFPSFASFSRRLAASHGDARWPWHFARSRAGVASANERPLSCSLPTRQAEAAWRELWPLFDAELLRLPDKYRLPVVLCCLEEKTHAEAARELGWPCGSVAGRLSRTRELLRARLARGGLTLTGATVAVLLAEKVARAATPALLTRLHGPCGGRIRRRNRRDGGQRRGARGGRLKGAFAVQVKIAAAFVLIVGLAAATAAGLAGRQPPPPASTPPRAAAPRSERTRACSRGLVRRSAAGRSGNTPWVGTVAYA